MRTVFADSFYWISLANPNDDWHETVQAVSRALGMVRLVTTDEVLNEFLAFYSGYGPFWRAQAVRLVKSIVANPGVQVIPQTRSSFEQALRLYDSRLDKEYSLTDCASMEVMRELGVREVLTHDHHFTQEGYTILFTEPV
ncbi:MAG TPA: PIN domain-containing protein [Tepidisphaeraceae bacterium]|nr:PIN domain-containing protein [Tepidisphaeraceae bacterium]